MSFCEILKRNLRRKNHEIWNIKLKDEKINWKERVKELIYKYSYLKIN